VQVNIKNLIDEAQCYQTVRALCWSDGIACPSCQSTQVVKRGFDDTEPARQRYACHDCDRRFDDLTDTLFAGQSAAESLGSVSVFHGTQLIERANWPGIGTQWQ
jgi:transposase-like protein